MKLIPLTQGKFAMVDDSDFDSLSEFKWHYAEDKKSGKSGYAKRRSKNKGPWIWMHKVVAGVGRHEKADHIDGDKLNNQSHNFRKATHAQNNYNRNIEGKRNSSGFKGVSWFPPARKFRARIKINRKEIHIGLFNNPKVAAGIYDDYAVYLFGDFAKTNRKLGLIP